MNEHRTSPVRIRPEILAVPGYRQGKTPTRAGFKLSSNENPFPVHPRVAEAVAAVPVNLYGAPAMTDLRARIGNEFGFDEAESQARVHLGAGSVAILYQLVQAVAGPGDEIVYPWPSFEAYPLLSIASGATSVPVPLTEAFEHDLDAMAAAITERTRAVLVCTPNNPTGPIVRLDEFERFMAQVPSDVLVVLDEAYREFVTDAEAVRGETLLSRYENLVVLRTFSKAYGLASLRIGYGVGHPAVWEAARVTGIPLSVTSQAEAAALAALEPETRAVLDTQIETIIERRETLVTSLRALGLHVPEAQGNFVWLPIGAASSDLADAFAEEGTLVRPFAGEGVRISVGEQESIAAVVRIVKDFIEKRPELVSGGSTP